ncbi:cellular nucleic acid-binding protein [Microdochium nivale]|nr:cellular nucleic acid-binding protein [Microdochium nivale]
MTHIVGLSAKGEMLLALTAGEETRQFVTDVVVAQLRRSVNKLEASRGDGEDATNAVLELLRVAGLYKEHWMPAVTNATATATAATKDSDDDKAQGPVSIKAHAIDPTPASNLGVVNPVSPSAGQPERENNRTPVQQKSPNTTSTPTTASAPPEPAVEAAHGALELDAEQTKSGPEQGDGKPPSQPAVTINTSCPDTPGQTADPDDTAFSDGTTQLPAKTLLSEAAEESPESSLASAGEVDSLVIVEDEAFYGNQPTTPLVEVLPGPCWGHTPEFEELFERAKRSGTPAGVTFRTPPPMLPTAPASPASDSASTVLGRTSTTTPDFDNQTITDSQWSDAITSATTPHTAMPELTRYTPNLNELRLWIEKPRAWHVSGKQASHSSSFWFLVSAGASEARAKIFHVGHNNLQNVTITFYAAEDRDEFYRNAKHWVVQPLRVLKQLYDVEVHINNDAAFNFLFESLQTKVGIRKAADQIIAENYIPQGSRPKLQVLHIAWSGKTHKNKNRTDDCLGILVVSFTSMAAANDIILHGLHCRGTRFAAHLHEPTIVLVQCHKCGELGHHTKLCRSAQRCMHCASPEHAKESCDGPDVPRCILCEGEHKSGFFDCPVKEQERRVLEDMATLGTVVRKSASGGTTTFYKNN